MSTAADLYARLLDVCATSGVDEADQAGVLALALGHTLAQRTGRDALQVRERCLAAMDRHRNNVALGLVRHTRRDRVGKR